MLIAFGTTLWIDLVLRWVWRNRGLIQDVHGMRGSVTMKRNVCVLALIVWHQYFHDPTFESEFLKTVFMFWVQSFRVQNQIFTLKLHQSHTAYLGLWHWERQTRKVCRIKFSSSGGWSWKSKRRDHQMKHGSFSLHPK